MADNGVVLVGPDVVEDAPVYDHTQITAVGASQVAHEIISAMSPAARHVSRSASPPDTPPQVGTTA